ncbi:uncharacterized protein SPPG_08316 [Spizellomyces punctatus DAOM BR117]|uniref:histone acetyltransferase n=1 Tax=Spizellomyces punctatus (strain DAOM BR117) TaxID=645134 RepID=A0A0L0H620_SPIPD|nr:uncharacterized protein SPPG_08316 [Spizellomyces punctatus DAOM BR117]KNC96419.1 hypothetical protein SPPG_08316 [Spizellomyces punctatus DAOM BR117]|eukprot:XP_016604459.1 hypothetical protein SPPG_08316 [Spizellomyces punctatus DAOM BR117]
MQESEHAPLHVGTLHLCKSSRGSTYRAKILDKREGNFPNTCEYYVHYCDCKYDDGRLDEWVSGDRLHEEELADEAAENSRYGNDLDGSHYNDGRKMTRNTKRKHKEGNNKNPHALFNETEPECEERPKIKNIDILQFGSVLMTPWYFAPYPAGENGQWRALYVCEFCFKYMKYSKSITWHRSHCKRRKPPGQVVYAKERLRIYEVDGKAEKLYCQNLCLLSKLFLDHKTVYYDTEPFLFYVLTESEVMKTDVDHAMGYFSKEKQSFESFNLACILILPPYQRKGYGRLLIEFSYELSKLDGKIGSPERPLSDLGLAGYKSYWQAVLVDILLNNTSTKCSINELARLTSMDEEDIIFTLDTMNLLRFCDVSHTICITPVMLEEFLRSSKTKWERSVDPECVNYVPLANR